MRRGFTARQKSDSFAIRREGKWDGMAKRLLTALAAVLCIGPAACTSPPRLPYESGVGVADVVRNIRCEMARGFAANRDKHPWLKTWAASVELTLDVTEVGSGDAAVDILVPFHGFDSGGLSLGGTHVASAQSISSISFLSMLAGIKTTECKDIQIPPGHEVMLRGSLGLTNWMTRAIDAIEATGTSAETTGIGYILEFAVVQHAGLEPSFSLIKVGDYELGGKIGVSASRDDTHTVSIAMVPVIEAIPLRVYVTNLGTVRTVSQGPAGKASDVSRAGQAPLPAAGVPLEARQQLNEIIRSLKQTQTGRP
jgi:hypothetical protein